MVEGEKSFSPVVSPKNILQVSDRLSLYTHQAGSMWANTHLKRHLFDSATATLTFSTSILCPCGTVLLQFCFTVEGQSYALLHGCVFEQIIAEIRLLRDQARLIVAGQLLARVDRFLATGRQHERKEVKAAVALLGGELKTIFHEVRQRAEECRGALDDWHSVSHLPPPVDARFFLCEFNTSRFKYARGNSSNILRKQRTVLRACLNRPRWNGWNRTRLFAFVRSTAVYTLLYTRIPTSNLFVSKVNS